MSIAQAPDGPTPNGTRVVQGWAAEAASLGKPPVGAGVTAWMVRSASARYALRSHVRCSANDSINKEHT